MTIGVRQRPLGGSEDPRAARSHDALTGALIELLNTKMLSEISVSELCEAAGIHRTTFYGHYADLFAFAADLGEGALSQLVAAASGPDDLAQMLTWVADHRSLYRLVFGPLDVGFRRALQGVLSDRLGDRAGSPLAAAFFAGGLSAALGEWTDRDDTDVTAYVAELDHLAAGLQP